MDEHGGFGEDAAAEGREAHDVGHVGADRLDVEVPVELALGRRLRALVSGRLDEPREQKLALVVVLDAELNKLDTKTGSLDSAGQWDLRS